MITVRHLPEIRAAAVAAERKIPEAQRGDEATRRHAATLRAASLWWANREMSQLAVAAAASLPEWTPAIVRPEPVGLMYWSSPIGQLDKEHLVGRLMDGAAAESVLRGAQVQGIHWSFTGELLHLTFYGTVPDAAERERSSPIWRNLYEVAVFAIPALHAFHPDHLEVRYRDFHEILHVMGASWLLMQQPTTAVTKRVKSNSGVGGTKKPKPIDTVQVIDLRRVASGKSENSETPVNAREYSHRWMVRGHWRQQRVGPGRKYSKPVYISPHIRGPEDAPLKTDRVNAWKR